MTDLVVDGPVLLILKATLLLAAGGTLTAAARRAPASLRHLIWSVTLVGLMLLPILSFGVPRWDIAVLPTPAAEAATVPGAIDAAMPVPDAVPGPRDLTAWTAAAGGLPATPAVDARSAEGTGSSMNPLLLLWGAGTLLVLVWIAAGQIGVMRLRRAARPVRDPEWLREAHDLTWILDIARPVALLRGVGTSTPMTWGMIWPTVLLPSEAEAWSAERRRMVLLHELAHVRRRDCLTQMVAHLACALFWFHPLAWYAARRLRIEREQACDDLVVRTGSPATDYADHLLHVARSLRAPRASGMAIAMARPSHLEGRLLAVLDPDRPREDPSAATRIAAVAALLLLAIPLAALRPAPAEAGPLTAGESRSFEHAATEGFRSPPIDEPPARGADPLHWQGTVRGGGTLAIYNMNGAVRAVGVAGRTARVRGERAQLRRNHRDVHLAYVQHDEGTTVCILPEGARCTPEGIRGADRGDRRSSGVRTADLTVEVPEDVMLRTETLNGALSLEDLRSDVRALTLNGAIDAVAAGNVEAKTLNGAVDVTMGRTDWSGELSLETLNGAIVVRLPDDASTRVEASTMHGPISADFPLHMERGRGRNRASGTIGAGGRTLSLSTLNGGIEIRRSGGPLPGASSTGTLRPGPRGDDAWAEFGESMAEFGQAMGELGERIAERVGQQVGDSFGRAPEASPPLREDPR